MQYASFEGVPRAVFTWEGFSLLGEAGFGGFTDAPPHYWPGASQCGGAELGEKVLHCVVVLFFCKPANYM